MNIITKTLKHFHTVNKHRWYVFKYSIKAGIPFRGLIHDLSKYSFTEFWEGVKYFDGHRSPIRFAKIDQGYSKAWLHHKGRNKHHFEYWEDIKNGERFGGFMPYKYIVECICDKIAASKVYKGKDYTDSYPLEYWNNVDKRIALVIHPGIAEFTDIVLGRIAKEGINNSLKPKWLKKIYNMVKKKYIK